MARVIFDFRLKPTVESGVPEVVIVEQHNENTVCLRFKDNGYYEMQRHVDVKVVDGKFEVVK